MEGYTSVILSSPLFAGVEAESLPIMLDCLGAAAKDYSKKEMILRAGDRVRAVGMVLRGSAYVENEDFWGNRNLIARAEPGDLFAEAFACSGAAAGVSVVAETDCRILFIDAGRILTSCTSACEFHSRTIRNLVAVIAEKNVAVNEKLTHMAQRTTRAKLLSYLSAQAGRHGSAEFQIPFDRQQLADFLCVDRSAMSAELGRLRNEGVLDFHKNSFRLRRMDE